MNPDLSTASNKVTKERLVLVAVGTTFLSLIPTAYAAIVSNSTTLFADLLRCLGEFFAIIVAWLVLRKMSRNEVSRFNYGYGKLEQLAGVAVAAALFLTFLVSFISGLRGLISPIPVENAEFGFVFALLSVLGNAVMWISNHLSNRRDNSPITESQARLFRAKTCATLVVVLALGATLLLPGVYLTIFVDPLGSVALSLFMLWQGYTMASASVPDLIDYAIEEKLQRSLDSILSDQRHLFSHIERIRSRRTTKKIYIELFLAFDPSLPFGRVHESVMVIKHAVSQGFPGADIVVIPSLPAASN